MKMEDILTLCKAGFTAEQIAAFTGGAETAGAETAGTETYGAETAGAETAGAENAGYHRRAVKRNFSTNCKNRDVEYSEFTHAGKRAER